MRDLEIAVVGAGGAGLLCARLLSSQYRVTLFEREDRVGGNARFHQVAGVSRFDLGVNVFHRTGYPNFFRVVEQLRLRTDPCNLTISFGLNRREQATYDYNNQKIVSSNRDLANLPSQGKSKRFKHFLDRYLNANPGASFGEFLEALPAPTSAKLMLRALSMGVWTMRSEDIETFPARFVIKQFRDLDLLGETNQHQWCCLQGGVSKYLDALLSGCQRMTQVHHPVESVARTDQGVAIQTEKTRYEFDAAVLATPGDIAHRLVKTPNEIERRLLPRFQSVAHPISLIRDRRRAINDPKDPSIDLFLYQSADGRYQTDRATTDVHRLTRGRMPPGFVLQHSQATNESSETLYSWTGFTPQFTPAAIDAASQHGEISGRDRIHYCGSYWGNGLHEDAVTSALWVAESFGVGLDALAR